MSMHEIYRLLMDAFHSNSISTSSQSFLTSFNRSITSSGEGCCTSVGVVSTGAEPVPVERAPAVDDDGLPVLNGVMEQPASASRRAREIRRDTERSLTPASRSGEHGFPRGLPA